MTSLVHSPVNPFPGVKFGELSNIDEQRQALAKDLEVDRFLLDHVQPHIPNLDVAGSLVDGYIERTVEGASTLQVVLSDPRLAILRSGLLSNSSGKMRSIDVELDGLWFSLTDINKSGTDITLTFEDQIVAELRKHDSFRKASRARMTRAQFIRLLLREVKRVQIRMYSPELTVRQKVQPLGREDAQKLRDYRRGPGFPAHYKIKVGSVTLGEQQKRNFEEALDEANAEAVSEKENIIMLMVILQESMGKTTATNGTHFGMYQQDAQPGSYWRQIDGATRNPTADTKAFLETLHPKYKATPDAKEEVLAESVQRSGEGKKYAKWKTKAQEIFDAYGGSQKQVTRYKHYEYTRGINGLRENTWDCAKRLGKDVEWRVFVVSGTFYYVSEDFLFKSKARALLKPGDDHGTDEINFDWKAGQVIKECTVTARMSRWAIPPGTIVEVDDSHAPADGKWLVSTIHRPLFGRSGLITLRKPVHAKLEPAAGITTRSIPRLKDGSKWTTEMTPKEIIDRVVLPIARSNGIHVTAKSVEEANARHGPTVNGGRSDHQGPPHEAWAADMSNGSQPTPQMDKLAAALAEKFDIPWNGSGLVSHTVDGFRFQLIYRTLQGGNHFNHVHFGVKRLGFPLHPVVH